MTTDQMFATLTQQNDVIISLLARLIWKPEQLAEKVAGKKRNPDAYIHVYNALDGTKTGTQLAEIAGVKQQSMSAVLQSWSDDGIVVNVGSETQPRYRRLMKISERSRPPAKNGSMPQIVESEGATNDNIPE